MTNQNNKNCSKPKLRPEYIKKAKKIIKTKAMNIGSIDKLKERLGV